MRISSVLPGNGGKGDDGGSSGNGGAGNGNVKKPNVKRANYALVGTVVASLLAVGMVVGITKPEWQQYLDWGFTTRDVHTTGDYFTLANSSKVKVSGVEVGRIDSVERLPDGSGLMHLRVASDVPEKVGSAPSANVRPVSLLGGVIYIEIVPGGDRTRPWEDDIPLNRTQLPTELSPVVQSLQPDAVRGIPASINGLDRALQAGSGRSLQGLAAAAPAALGPGAGVINSLAGNNPGTDLPAVVDGLQRTTSVLSRRDQQIESILRDLHTTTTVFRQTSRPVAEAINRLPEALDTARPGLARLSGSLDKLRETAGPARPTVQEADRLLGRLDPVLAKARPVVNDLRYAVQELRPVVQGLTPASQDLTTVFDGLNAPLDRVNGPIVDTLEAGYTPNEGADAGRRHTQVPGEHADKLRQEIGPAIRGFNGAGGYNDANAHGIAFNAGLGTGSVAGVGGLSLPTLYQLMNPSAATNPLLTGGALPNPAGALGAPTTGGPAR